MLRTATFLLVSIPHLPVVLRMTLLALIVHTVNLVTSPLTQIQGAIKRREQLAMGVRRLPLTG